MTQETISIKKTDLLSLVNNLENRKNNKNSKYPFLSKICSFGRNSSDLEKESQAINKIWKDCLEYESKKKLYLHEFLIPKETYNSYLKKYF